MLGKVRTGIDYYEFASNCRDWKFSSELTSGDVDTFKQLIDFIVENDGLIVCGENSGEVMWAEEIRYDYKNGEIYLPYIKSDYMKVNSSLKILQDKYKRNSIAYNNRLDKYIIYKDGHYIVDCIYFIVGLDDGVYCSRACLDGIELCSASYLSSSARELYMKYIRQSYGYTYCENDITQFYSVNKSKISNTEKHLIDKLKLNYYDDFTDIAYQDTRNYRLEDLAYVYSKEELGLDIAYNIKRIAFESELFCGIQNRHIWEGWTKGSIADVYNGNNYFCKYKEHGFSFIFKKRWIS